jgi:hypothetical protein
MKLSDKLDRLKAANPKRSRYGQLYRPPLAPAGAKIKRVTMHTLLESDEHTHLLHECVFDKSKTEGKTAAEWADWFSRNFARVYNEGVLPGVNIRTNKLWRVQRVVGWTSAKRQLKNSTVSKRRHKVKR